jgi:hypothetical protein
MKIDVIDQRTGRLKAMTRAQADYVIRAGRGRYITRDMVAADDQQPQEPQGAGEATEGSETAVEVVDQGGGATSPQTSAPASASAPAPADAAAPVPPVADATKPRPKRNTTSAD